MDRTNLYKVDHHYSTNTWDGVLGMVKWNLKTNIYELAHA